MNERVKELKKQAWEYAMAVHDGHIVPPLDKEVWPLDEVFDEKFGELIVRECARVYWNIDNGETHTEYVEALKQHFGVEE